MSDTARRATQLPIELAFGDATTGHHHYGEDVWEMHFGWLNVEQLELPGIVGDHISIYERFNIGLMLPEG